MKYAIDLDRSRLLSSMKKVGLKAKKKGGVNTEYKLNKKIKKGSIKLPLY
ncbi:hypothetical protein VrSk94_18480 [Vibrio rotiferianus]